MLLTLLRLHHSAMPSLSASCLDCLLSEDVPNGDLTTLALEIGGMPGAMEFRARGDMVVAGTEIAADMIMRAGADASILMPSGSKAKAGYLVWRHRERRRRFTSLEDRADVDRDPLGHRHCDARTR